MADTDDDLENLPVDPEVKSGEQLEDGVEEEEEVEEESEHESIYDTNDFISGMEFSENSKLPSNILEFDFSYGYDCRKLFNLAVLDENHIVFSSGNFINFYNLETKKIWFRRSALGGGIGHIKKNPNPDYPYFAVAESGLAPIIILYEWPSLEINCILREGSKRIYKNIDFSPDGFFLVSQGGPPDYLITVFDWNKHKITLRTKSHVNDIYKVKFSPYVPGQLTTCGMQHIKFWNMTNTFTGLKLKGELGRFGKTEYSDIIGVLPMPDEKVVSGCAWGNILIWDGGLITIEVLRPMRKKCHEAPIVQFFYVEGELWTVSMDGHVKIWWYEKIDQADPPDDDRVVLMDPTYDFYTPGLMLMSLEKRRPHEPTDTEFIAQDGNGGIWLLDINTEEEPRPGVQQYKCHAGKIMDMAACPHAPFFASLGQTGDFFVYNYELKQSVNSYHFKIDGACVIWVPLSIVPTGDIVLLGFANGQVRVCCLTSEDMEYSSMNIVQSIRPHSKPITKMSINNLGTVFVTASEDSTLFMFKIQKHNIANFLEPIGFIQTPDVVTFMEWHYENDYKILLGCQHGQMAEVTIPYFETHNTSVTYRIQAETVENKFNTYKAQIRRDIKIAEIEARKAEKVERKREELVKIKEQNPGLEINEDAFLADSDTEEILEPLFIPEVPNKILWLQYTSDKTIWLSMAGYDAGYIYEYLIDQKDTAPTRFKMVDDADDIEISSYCYSWNRDFLVFAMQDGTIRLNKFYKSDFSNLSDYCTLAMHDNQNGFVSKMCFSYDEKYFFTCGHDGNIFSYRFNPPDNYVYPTIHAAKTRLKDTVALTVDQLYQPRSLEEAKIKAEEDRILRLANQHKQEVRDRLKDLRERYTKLLAKNEELLPTQKIPREALELDERVAKYVEDMLQARLDLVKRKKAYDVEKSSVRLKKLLAYFIEPCDALPFSIKAINQPNLEVLSMRQRVLSQEYFEMLQIIDAKLLEEEVKGRSLKNSKIRPPERQTAVAKPPPPKPEEQIAPLEYFLLSLMPSVIQQKLGTQLTRLLMKYRRRRAKWSTRSNEWDEFMNLKPIPGKNHPDDEKFLEMAKKQLWKLHVKGQP